jgi:hypothetical protein
VAGSPDDAFREVSLAYDSSTREMTVVYDPSDQYGCRRVFNVRPWEGEARFFVDESRAANCPKWVIAINVRGMFPGEVSVKYELADFDYFPV